MKGIRTGLGFDVHRFKRGRRLVLGGVEIPHGRGLDGHSDADVLVHAVMDALLGAVADGDIGIHFPNNESKWKDADSIGLLRHVMCRLKSRRAAVVNVDTTIIAQEPRVMVHAPAMKKALARAMGIGVGDVSIKATTPEKMGALGRAEGIAVLAVATVKVAGAGRRKKT